MIDPYDPFLELREVEFGIKFFFDKRDRAVEEQDFDKAASYRDQAVDLKKRRVEIIKEKATKSYECGCGWKGSLIECISLNSPPVCPRCSREWSRMIELDKQKE